ncbi:hypothetical protein ABZT06_50445, partial [Streptomyces sp. NPDC005483]
VRPAVPPPPAQSPQPHEARPAGGAVAYLDAPRGGGQAGPWQQQPARHPGPYGAGPLPTDTTSTTASSSAASSSKGPAAATTNGPLPGPAADDPRIIRWAASRNWTVPHATTLFTWASGIVGRALQHRPAIGDTPLASAYRDSLHRVIMAVAVARTEAHTTPKGKGTELAPDPGYEEQVITRLRAVFTALDTHPHDSAAVRTANENAAELVPDLDDHDLHTLHTLHDNLTTPEQPTSRPTGHAPLIPGTETRTATGPRAGTADQDASPTLHYRLRPAPGHDETEHTEHTARDIRAIAAGRHISLTDTRLEIEVAEPDLHTLLPVLTQLVEDLNHTILVMIPNREEPLLNLCPPS